MNELLKNKTAMDLLKDYLWFNLIETATPDLQGMIYIDKHGYRAWAAADASNLKAHIEAAIAENPLPLFDGEEYSLVQLGGWMASPQSASALAALGAHLGLWTLNSPLTPEQRVNRQPDYDNDSNAELGLLSIRAADPSGYQAGEVAGDLAQFLAMNTLVLEKPFDFPCIDMGYRHILVKQDACIDQFITYVQSLGDQGLNLFDLREHSYIEIGGYLGSQDLALRFMAVCCEMGLARLLTPATMLKISNDSDMGQQMLGQGLLTIYFIARSVEESKSNYKMSIR